MPIFGVRNFTLNQHLGSVNYNMDKNSIFWVHGSEKRKNRGVWCESPRVPKTLGLIFRSQQRNRGMDPPALKVREYPPGQILLLFL